MLVRIKYQIIIVSFMIYEPVSTSFIRQKD